MLLDSGTFSGTSFLFWTQRPYLPYVPLFVSILTIFTLIHSLHNLTCGFLKLSSRLYLPLFFPLPQTQSSFYHISDSIVLKDCFNDVTLLVKDHNGSLVNTHLTHFIFRPGFLSLSFPLSSSLQSVLSLLYTYPILRFQLNRATHMNLVIYKWTRYCLYVPGPFYTHVSPVLQGLETWAQHFLYFITSRISDTICAPPIRCIGERFGKLKREGSHPWLFPLLIVMGSLCYFTPWEARL